MEQVDSLIQARWVVPVEPHGTVLENHVVAVRDGRIVALLPAPEAERRYRADHRTALPHHVLIPGLVNAHTHAAMSLLRGLADDLPLMEWLHEHIWPAEQAHVSAEFVRHGAELAIAEMLRTGTTCFMDMYFFPEEVAQAATRAGIRAVMGMIVIDFPSAYAAGPEDYLNRGLALRDAYRHDPLISTAFAPHAPYTVAPEHLRRIRTLADELDVPVNIHLHETAHEVTEAVKRHGRRPLAGLDQLGLVSPELVAVHMTQLEPPEILRLAEAGASVVHCPESNLKLASGFCPAAELVEAGVNLCLGTDGAASNNDLDMVGEMHTAALLAKAVAGDAAALPAATVLRMAPLNGARALGLADAIGSLEPGKYADLTAVDLGGVGSLPVYHPLSQLVYSGAGDRVSDVWVAGRQLLHGGVLTTLDTGEIARQAAQWRDIMRNLEAH